MLRTTLAALALAFSMTACTETAPGEPKAPPAAVVVAFDRENVTPLIAEGVRNFESQELVEFNDPVRIASISKLIMAIATARLVDEGKIDLNADVSDYLGFKVRSPKFPDTPVTLAQLMSHRAGLRDKAGYIIPLGESLEEKLTDPEAWYADAPPGEAPFEYANLGSPVVATALEAATGERYDTLLERTVFGPLGVEACVNWVGCSDDMVARAVALYRHTDEPARDYPGDLPPGCSIPVAEGVECTLDGYTPGTNASVFSPQGGVRIGMMDLAKIGQAFDEESGFFSDAAKAGFDRAWVDSFHPEQEFFCIYGQHLQIIDSPKELWESGEQAKPETCKDTLFGDGVARVGHSGEAYGLQSGLWFDLSTGSGVAFFRTQAPPPEGGEDTGGFSKGEKELIARAMGALKAAQAKQESE